MTARISPERNYLHDPNQTSQQPQEDQGSQQSTDLNEYYVPEREFVLMPLFRRIGRMLGFKQAEEPEYVYTPETAGEEPAAGAQRAEMPVAASEPKNVVPMPTWENEATADQIHPAAALNFEEMQHAESPEAIAETHADEGEGLIVRQADDILGLEPELAPVSHFIKTEESPAPTAPVHAAADSEEIVDPVQQQTQIETPVEVVAFQAEPHEAQSELVEQIHEPKHEPETLVAAAAVSEMPEPVSTRLSHDEASDLANQIREAASKISAAVAQAAEWLHTKEEEILRRTEMPLTPKRHVEQDQAMLRTSETLRADASNTAAVPEWEATEAPALQRERAWQEKKARFSVVSSAADQNGRSSKRKRIGTINVAWFRDHWRRIDWAHEFAPKRVAILGGVLMAILMVLGISFARHPASSDLPQQTRSIEPGGVTVTTHPQTAPAPVIRAEKKPAVVKEYVEPHRTRRSAVDNEPDVVTHYYNQKPKPSPSHPMTAAAGVRHYSDMQ